MPSSVRSRVALFALLAVFVIQIAASSLDGLTHVLTCHQATNAPFTLVVPEQGRPTILSSVRLERGAGAGRLCGGLTLDIAVGADTPGHLKIRLPITNHSKYTWRGSVKLRLGAVSIPVNVGAVKAGRTVASTVRVRIDPGSHEIGGSLLIGP